MNFDFELILFCLVITSGVIALVDKIFLAKNRAHLGQFALTVTEYARSFFPVLLLVFCLRSFLFETFRIPSGSLEPTLLVGDFIAVNKFAYGIRLPVIHKKIYPIGEPKRGDIFVFFWPPNPAYHLIKRVIGLPGDKISYINKVLYINGERIPETFTQSTTYAAEVEVPAIQQEENLLGIKHAIYQFPDHISGDFHNIVVPQGMYFAMGDNRDDSADSRFFGFVPEENIVGRADVKWFSWDKDHYSVRWQRIFSGVH